MISRLCFPLACCVSGSCFVVAQTEPHAADEYENRLATPDGTIRVRRYRENGRRSPGTLRLSGTWEMVLIVDHAADWDMVPLEFAETLGDFRIGHLERLPLLIRENRQVHRFRMTLVPEQVGKNRVGAIPIVCRLYGKPGVPSPSGDAGDISGEESIFPLDERVLCVPAFELDVTSAVSSDVTLEDVFRPPGPRNIVDYGPYRVFAAIVAGLIFVALIVRRLRSLRTTPVHIVQNTANRRAMKKLAILLDSRLHERDVKLFYTNLTAVVRWYIEQKTAIRAPELTTEEFLREMTLRENPPEDEVATEGTPEDREEDVAENRSFFSAKTRALLAEFLEVADLVKFARFRPSHEQIMLGFRRASEFIERGNRFADARPPGSGETELFVTERHITGAHAAVAVRTTSRHAGTSDPASDIP